MWTIFKVFIKFAAVLLLFYVVAFWLQGMWDLSFLTRCWTHTPFSGRWSLNHWTTREVPDLSFLSFLCGRQLLRWWLLLECGLNLVKLMGYFFQGQVVRDFCSLLLSLWELVMDREASHAAVHAVTESRTWLKDWTELNFSLLTCSLWWTWLPCCKEASTHALQATSSQQLVSSWSSQSNAPCGVESCWKPWSELGSGSCPSHAFRWLQPPQHLDCSLWDLVSKRTQLNWAQVLESQV